MSENFNMVNSLENIDKLRITVDRIEGLDAKIQEELFTTITGAASTIITTDLTANRAVISNGNGKVVVSSTTSTELGYVHGVTSEIQTQLNAKQDIANLSQTLDDSITKYPSNNAVKTAIDAKDSLPAQSGQSGKFLTTDGTTASWGTVDVSGAINTHNTDLNAHSNKFKVVSSLPSSPDASVFYFIPEQ